MSLGNVIPAAYKLSVIPFLSEADKDLLEKHRVAAFEVRTLFEQPFFSDTGATYIKTAMIASGPKFTDAMRFTTSNLFSKFIRSACTKLEATVVNYIF